MFPARPSRRLGRRDRFGQVFQPWFACFRRLREIAHFRPASFVASAPGSRLGIGVISAPIVTKHPPAPLTGGAGAGGKKKARLRGRADGPSGRCSRMHRPLGTRVVRRRQSPSWRVPWLSPWALEPCCRPGHRHQHCQCRQRRWCRCRRSRRRAAEECPRQCSPVW